MIRLRNVLNRNNIQLQSGLQDRAVHVICILSKRHVLKHETAKRNQASETKRAKRNLQSGRNEQNKTESPKQS